MFTDEELLDQLGTTASPLKRKRTSTSRQEKKKARQSGKEYVDVNGKYKSAKEFFFAYCKCSYQCKTVSTVERLGLFQDFWNMRCWQSQSNFILSCVEVSAVKRSTVGDKHSRRSNSRVFTLNNKRVCQYVFTKTLGVTSSRVNYCLNMKSYNKMCSPDKRGKKPSSKTDPVVISGVRDFLSKIPKYESHYSLSERVYFSPDLNKQKLYNMYCKSVTCPCSKSIFDRCFKEYNVGFYIPRSDTCKTCDTLKVKKLSATAPDDIQAIEETKKAHLGRAQSARLRMKEAGEESKANPKVLSISFDMQQTSPLPKIETSVVFYKRQLWVYNLGIHNLKNNDAHMMVWLEGDAKRGSSEVCSSIFEFLIKMKLENYEEIRSFSDCCGGQNRNRQLICFTMYVCNMFGIKCWEHQFLESGHTYLPNDRDFGLIGKRAKHANAYNLEQWISIIESARVKNPFKVTKMKSKFRDFESLVNSRKLVHSRTTATTKFSFAKLCYFKVEKDSNAVFYRDCDSDVLHTLDYQRLNCDVDEVIGVKDASEKIAAPKYKDLLSMLDLIPDKFKEFYVNLPH